MKVVAFNGSPRKNGNTAFLIREVLQVLEKEGIQTELVQVGGRPVRGCMACYQCREIKDRRCIYNDDMINEWIGKMLEADGMLIGSPTYFAGLTPETKALIDRAGFVSRGNGNIFRRKVGAAVIAVRRGGALNVFNAINAFFLINEMIVPGSSYWNLGLGGGMGEVQEDAEGIRTMKKLGENMAWLLKKVNTERY
ncbi:MAG: flavodoxin family protein [Firmicutes bacterium]|nr:flavodoxin family protein [Bacillota bacterium]